MTPQWITYCVQELQWSIISDVILYALILIVLAGVLPLFRFVKPLKRFWSKAKAVLPLLMIVTLSLALIRIVPKIIDIQTRSFVMVEDATIQRTVTHTTPFHSRYIMISSSDTSDGVVRLNHSSLIPFDEDPDTVYHGTVIYAEKSATLLYVEWDEQQSYYDLK